MPRSDHASGHSFGTGAEWRLVGGADLPSQGADVCDDHWRPTTPSRSSPRAGDTARGRQRELRASLRRPGADLVAALPVGHGATATGATG